MARLRRSKVDTSGRGIDRAECLGDALANEFKGRSHFGVQRDGIDCGHTSVDEIGNDGHCGLGADNPSAWCCARCSGDQAGANCRSVELLVGQCGEHREQLLVVDE